MASNFDRLASKLAQRPGVNDPRALAAAIGANKYGRATMQQAAARGIPAGKVRGKK